MLEKTKMLNSPGCISAFTHRWEDAMSNTLTQLTLLKLNILFALTNCIACKFRYSRVHLHVTC